MATIISPRIGLVCFPDNYEDQEQNFRHHQLLLFLQQQACMAGIPNELVDVDRLSQPTSFATNQRWVFILSLFHTAQSKELDSQLMLLLKLVQSRNSGLIVLGMPVCESNYESSQNILFDFLGMQAGAAVTLANADFIQGEQARHILGSDFQWDKCHLSESHIQSIRSSPDHHTEVAHLVSENRREPVIIAGELPVRFITLIDHQLLSQQNWLWRAIRWAAYGSAESVALKLSRSPCAFAARVDMDLSKYRSKADPVYPALIELFRSWKKKYGFVSSAYINIGSNTSDGEYTDWSVSAPLYRELTSLGNEIGSHSYTHPFHVSELSEQDIRFEFNDAREVIEQNLGFRVEGCAIPGNPETVSAAKQIGIYYKYVSGRFSGHGDGYPGAIGLLTPGSNFLYFCPNIWPDFTAIRFFNWTTAKTQQEWRLQIKALMDNASVPVIQPLWHDYAMTEELGDGFEICIYESLLNWAVEKKAEFITLGNIANRIDTLNSARVEVLNRPNGLDVSVSSTGPSLGYMCLTLSGDSIISSVDNWLAHNDHQVYLPREGGKFTIHFDTVRSDDLRIVALPSNAELIDVKRGKNCVMLEIKGEGLIEIETSGRPIACDAEFVQVQSDKSNAGKNAVLKLCGNRTHSIKVVVVE